MVYIKKPHKTNYFGGKLPDFRPLALYKHKDLSSHTEGADELVYDEMSLRQIGRPVIGNRCLKYKAGVTITFESIMGTLMGLTKVAGVWAWRDMSGLLSGNTLTMNATHERYGAFKDDVWCCALETGAIEEYGIDFVNEVVYDISISDQKVITTDNALPLFPFSGEIRGWSYPASLEFNPESVPYFTSWQGVNDRRLQENTEIIVSSLQTDEFGNKTVDDAGVQIGKTTIDNEIAYNIYADPTLAYVDRLDNFIFRTGTGNRSFAGDLYLDIELMASNYLNYIQIDDYHYEYTIDPIMLGFGFDIDHEYLADFFKVLNAGALGSGAHPNGGNDNYPSTAGYGSYTSTEIRAALDDVLGVGWSVGFIESCVNAGIHTSTFQDTKYYLQRRYRYNQDITMSEGRVQRTIPTTDFSVNAVRVPWLNTGLKNYSVINFVQRHRDEKLWCRLFDFKFTSTSASLPSINKLVDVNNKPLLYKGPRDWPAQKNPDGSLNLAYEFWNRPAEWDNYIPGQTESDTVMERNNGGSYDRLCVFENAPQNEQLTRAQRFTKDKI